MPTREQLTDLYRRMPTEQLLLIATTEAAGLTPEALDVLRSEVASRGMPAEVDAAVGMQTVELSGRDLDVLVERVQAAPCPACGGTDRPLNAAEIFEVKSLVFFSTQDREILIACPDCLKRAAKRASARTLLLGWWGLPWGPIGTVRAVYRNARVGRGDRDNPSELLRTFVAENPGIATVLAGVKV